MEKSIITSGKTIDLAIESALSQLGLDRDSVSVTVLQQAKSGFLGFGAQSAKVQVTYEVPDPVPEKEEKPKSALGSASRSKPKAPAAPVKKPEAPQPPKAEPPKPAPQPVPTPAPAKRPEPPKQDKPRAPKPPPSGEAQGACRAQNLHPRRARLCGGEDRSLHQGPAGTHGFQCRSPLLEGRGQYVQG